MKLHILGSSSSGNGYLLQSSQTGEVLCLEAGVHPRILKKALDYDISHIVGCCVTHEHGDHAGYVNSMHKAFIPLVMTKGTAEAKDIKGFQVPSAKHMVHLGDFRVLSFPTMHDAAEPCGYLIRHPECGTVLFATDTYYLPNRFYGLNNIIIECNYSLSILQSNYAAGIINRKRRDRIIKSHMSYETCCETLMANNLSKVNNIVLCHLSADNADATEFADGIAQLTGKNVICARKGITIDFNKTPY